MSTFRGECYVGQVLGRRQMRNWRDGLKREQVDILERDLKGSKVRYKLPNGSRRQYNLPVEAASSQEIPDLNQPVETFFQVTNKVKLSHPVLPCLWLVPISKTIYIPIQFCIMMGQPIPRHKVFHDESVSKMIRTTAATPMVRQERIMEELKRNINMYTNDPWLDLARLSKGNYEAMVKQLVIVANVVRIV